MNKAVSIEHIAIAVADLNQAIEAFAVILNCGPDAIEEVKEQGVRVAVFRPAGNDTTAIELICPLDKDNSIGKFIEKHGQGLHHISLNVSDISSKLNDLKKNGFRLINETPRDGAEGKKIAFMHPSAASGVLIELEQD